MTYSEITRLYLGKTRLTIRDFARQLSEVMPPSKTGRPAFSHGSIGHWKLGTHEPDAYKLSLLIGRTGGDDWRHQFAVDILTQIDPDLLQDSTKLARMQEPCQGGEGV